MAKTRTLRRLAAALFAVCVVAAVAAAASLLHSAGEYREGDAGYAALKSVYLGTADAPDSGASAADPAAAFDRLEVLCPGLTAWVSVEGTPIDYPVMQAEDNQTYLNTTADGKENAAGSIFLDCRNSRGYTDKNSILYGHALKTGKMFGSLKEYLDYAYWQAHPSAVLTTPEGSFRCEIFAAYKTTAGSASYTRTFESSGAFEAFLSDIQAKSAYETGVEVSASDRVLTLSTCTNQERDSRYVVHARILSE